MRQASHETVVNLIRKSGDLVALTVVTILPQMMYNGNGGNVSLTSSTTASPLPSVMSMSITTGSVIPGSGANSTTSNQSRQYSTLPRKLHGSGGKLQVQPPPPPKRDPNTTLSVGKARAKSMVANLAAIGMMDQLIIILYLKF